VVGVDRDRDENLVFWCPSSLSECWLSTSWLQFSAQCFLENMYFFFCQVFVFLPQKFFLLICPSLFSPQDPRPGGWISDTDLRSSTPSPHPHPFSQQLPFSEGLASCQRAPLLNEFQKKKKKKDKKS
jgi:hypothetical protein